MPANVSWSRLRNLHRRVLAVVSFLLLLTCPEASQAGDNQEASETRLKAAFLLKFPKYVEWPSEAFDGTNSPIVMVVFGADAFASELEELTRSRTIQGRPWEVRRAARVEDIPEKCHVLFVDESERRKVPAIVKKLGHAGVLTVGESNDFLDNGGIINLSRHNQGISLEVNLISAGTAGLTISSQLLKLARIREFESTMNHP